MFNAWLPAFYAFAAANWLAVWRGWRVMNYLTKPAAMLALLLWFCTAGRFAGGLLWFAIGFFFSLLGDILLMLGRRCFTVGLGAFLFAHLAYIAAFNQSLPALSIPFYVMGLVLVSVWAFIFSCLQRAMKRSSLHARLVLPVGAYSAVLTLMLFSALLTFLRPEWNADAAALAAGGGLLFYCSDTMLAFDRFIKPFAHARLWVRATYHMGQLGLAAGALLAALD